ncbi:MAG: transcription antitermination factor NusB [Patescibacteria group bacterium]
MASNRHLGRIIALQVLYEYDFRLDCGDEDADLDAISIRSIDRYRDTIEDTEFINDLIQGVLSKSDELDDELQPIAPEWPISQIARVDRIVLRMGLYELKYSPSVPPKVVINEAVELAKSFGGDSSSKFVNGVLGTAYRNLGGDKEDAPKKTKTSQKKDKVKASGKKTKTD